MGVISSTVYSIRNAGKGVKGESARFIVSADQAVNVALNKSSKIVDTVDNAAQSIFHAADASTKLAKFTSSAVNPLLIGAAGIRVLRDDDKKSALIEEGLAMSAMFGCEKLYKVARNTVKQGLEGAVETGSTKAAKATAKAAAKTFSNKTIVEKATKLSNELNKLTKGSKGKKKVLFIAAELLAVGVSILSYNLGKKIGKSITGRNESTTQAKNSNPFG